MFKQFRSEPLTEPEKRYLRKKNGVKQRFAMDKVVETKPSDDPKFIAPYVIGKISKRRRFNGCRLSDDIRASVERKRTLNQAFHAALRAELAGR
jgi:hypothetical protein